MKKIIFIFFICLCMLCGCDRNDPRSIVDSYMKMYVNKDDVVLEQLDNNIKNENLSNENESLYRDVMIRVYSNIDYEIVKETYIDNYSYVLVNIKVLDLYKVSKDSVNYLNSNEKEFCDSDGNYVRSKFINYKLRKMYECNDTISYNIEFKLENNDSKWEMVQPSNDVIEKLHGIYNYEI